VDGIVIERSQSHLWARQVGQNGDAPGQEEQTRRFSERITDARKIWKLSPMDLESHRRWEQR
jgi:hypothetical protein